MVSDASFTDVLFFEAGPVPIQLCTDIEDMGEECTLTLCHGGIQEDHVEAVCHMRTSEKALK